LNVSPANGLRLWEMVWGAGPMVKFVLLILFLFSVFSWAIIIYKAVLLRKVEKETAKFTDLFWDKRQFAQIHAAAKGFRATPLAPMFSAAYAEIANSVKADEGGAEAPRLKREDLERVSRVLRKAAAIETERLEYAVSFLATTGNTAPFIGLFGTVWGIMNSFTAIGARGSANLASVAPGISEALVATAIGLLAAIPAVMGYNHIVTRTGRIATEMSNFSTDLLNVIEKQSMKGREGGA
jgi:biopolymer transport protein TolQ